MSAAAFASVEVRAASRTEGHDARHDVPARETAGGQVARLPHQQERPPLRRAHLERAVGVRHPPLPRGQDDLQGDPVGAPPPGSLHSRTPEHKHRQTRQSSRVSRKDPRLHEKTLLQSHRNTIL